MYALAASRAVRLSRPSSRELAGPDERGSTFQRLLTFQVIHFIVLPSKYNQQGSRYTSQSPTMPELHPINPSIPVASLILTHEPCLLHVHVPSLLWLLLRHARHVHSHSLHSSRHAVHTGVTPHLHACLLRHHSTVVPCRQGHQSTGGLRAQGVVFVCEASR